MEFGTLGDLEPTPADTKGQVHHKKPRPSQRPHSPSLPLFGHSVMALVLSLTLSLPFLVFLFHFPWALIFSCVHVHI